MTQRIGFACKWIDHPAQVSGIRPLDEAKKYNTGTTTVAWLKRQSATKAEQKLWELMTQNIQSIRLLVERVSKRPEQMRMVRLSSDILPVYTHPDWSWFYRQAVVQDFCSSKFAEIGALAREHDIRLSFHPAQFCVLASSDTGIVQRSIEEFEYHADMARWMNYGSAWHDHGFKINVHIAGRGGPAGILATLPKLSTEARNLITIENEEISWGLDSCLELERSVAIVLDIHHHFINTGEYISPQDDRVKRVVDSWRGVRPVAHYSQTRESVLPDHCPNTLPNLAELKALGHKVQQLRAHSDFYWNNAVNQWAAGFAENFDLMLESKAKNLAQEQFYNTYIKTK